MLSFCVEILITRHWWLYRGHKQSVRNPQPLSLFESVYFRVCVCACARARARVRVRVCVCVNCGLRYLLMPGSRITDTNIFNVGYSLSFYSQCCGKANTETSLDRINTSCLLAG